MKSNKLSISFSMFLASFSLGIAQEEAPELDALKVTATPFDKSSEDLAQPWYVIAEEELNRLMQATLGETLGWKPGVSSTSFTGGASRPIIRGHGGNRVRILSNGLGTQDLSNTSPDHAITIDPLMVEQVEILRGPATLLYGGAANGGAVNIIDGRIPSSLPTETSGGVSAGYIGASEGKYASLKFDIPTGKYVFHFDATFRDSKDYTTPSFDPHAGEEHDEEEEEEEDEGPVGFVDNSFMDFEDKAIGLTYFGESSKFGILFNRVDTKYGALTEEHHHEEEEEEEEEHEEHEEEVGRPFIDMTQDRLTLSASFDLDTDLINSISGSYIFSDYYHGEWEDADELGTAFDLESQETRWEIAHSAIADFSGIVGFQINIDELTLPEVESSYAGNNITGVDTDKSALFILEEKSLTEALQWEVGGRVESTSHELTGNTTKRNRDYDAVSGSTSLIYDYSDDFKLAASFNYSERAPSGEELYSNGVHHATGTHITGDDSLGLEISKGWDFSIKKVAGSFTGELVFFSTSYDGYIYQAESEEEDDHEEEHDDHGHTERHYAGVDASFQGFEANLSFPVFEDGDRALFLRGMFDYVNAENDTDNESLPRIPPMRIGAALEYTYGSFLGTLEARHAFEQDDFAHGETVTPSFTMLNARVDYQVFDEDKAWNAFVEARNLTDELAYNSSSYRKALAPLPGRSINFGLNYKF